MKITNKKTGHSFNLSGKGAADFFYSKNANGQYINLEEDYSIDDSTNEISQAKFVLCCLGLVALVISSFLLHLHLNY
jgi:hypothetical protein